VSSAAAAMYRSVYESNYMISTMIKSRNIKVNYITTWRVNAGCFEVITWSCVEVVRMVVWSMLRFSVRSLCACVLVVC
jgi:hypothetical protein